MRKKGVKEKKNQVFLRPPVVTIMGHVDHGKTTLLDYIRKTNVAAKEFGGITQHIGAYQVKIKDQDPKKERYITFIDTPGHEAFLKMRARGAEVTDIVVLVVAADDGVMPQTIESISHIKKAQVPYLVAINKTDLEGVDIEKVKRQLARNDVLVEGFGGNIVCVNISAKTGKGVDELLEMILLLAEMNPERFKSDPNGPVEAYVIESKLERNVGPLATVLVKNGTLRVNDKIIIDGIPGKIRAMKNEWGKNLSFAGPSTPVEILGLEKVPIVGAKVDVISEETKKIEKLKKELIQRKKELPKEEEKKEEFLKIILKTDTFGSLEALIYSLPQDVEVYHKGVGDITEADVLLAKTVGAIIIGFNVKIPKSVEKLAETEKVLVKNYHIIYELLDEIKEVILEMKRPKPKEKILGKAKIIADFLGTSGRIAGCKVIEGRIKNDDILRVEREGKKIKEDLRIFSMKHLKQDVKQVSMGMECGIILLPEVDFKIGDMIISYRPTED